MPVVFLNLDGVVHPVQTQYVMALESSAQPRPFSWSEPLQELADRLDLQFVLRSSATEVLGLEKVKSLAPSWLQPRIVGETDAVIQWLSLYDAHKVATNFEVIKRYADAHDLAVWAALDDSDDGWPADSTFRSSLIRCDPQLGVRDPKVLKRLEATLRAGA